MREMFGDWSLDKLDTPGGHVALCFVVWLIGVTLEAFRVEGGRDVAQTAQGALYLAINVRRA